MTVTPSIDGVRLIEEQLAQASPDLLRELLSLSKGQVIVSGASVNTPVMLRVRRRITEHDGVDL